MNAIPERLSSTLDAVSTKTKVVALIALVVEALFILGAAFLPIEHRIWAFTTCGILLLAALTGIFYIESLEYQRAPTTTTSQFHLPPELAHRAILISSYLSTAHGAIAERYRTATNLKYVGKYGDALRHYQVILLEDPTHVLARYNTGSCLLYLNRDQEASQVYEHLIQNFASIQWRGDEERTRILHGCYMQLYCLAERAEDFGKGEDLLVRSLEVRPDDVLTYLNLSICCLKAGKTAEGIKWYDVLMKHPDRIAALSELEPTDKNLLESITQLKHRNENT